MATKLPDMFAGAALADRYLLMDLYKLVEAMNRSDRKITRDVLLGLVHTDAMGDPGALLMERRPQPHEAVYLARYMANHLLTTSAWARAGRAGIERYIKQVSRSIGFKVCNFFYEIFSDLPVPLRS